MFRAALVFAFPNPNTIVNTVEAVKPTVTINISSWVSPIMYLTKFGAFT